MHVIIYIEHFIENHNFIFVDTFKLKNNNNCTERLNCRHVDMSMFKSSVRLSQSRGLSFCPTGCGEAPATIRLFH